MNQETSLAVDIGGTFTDVILFRGDEVYIEKTLTTHEDLLTGFFRGVDAVLSRSESLPQDINGVVVHATTVVTNALIERKGAHTAMIFTHGFSDILNIRDCRRYDMYDLQIDMPRPLVESADIYTIKERVLANGSIATPIEESDCDDLCRRLAEQDIKSVGICLLNSFKNDVHERRLEAAIKARLPGVYVSRSSEIAPQIREYWRASTISVNAYAVPITEPYLGELAKRLESSGIRNKALIMLSSGGLVGPTTAGKMPVRMIESGPAAGALGSAFAARTLGINSMIAFDMGGTTAKVCLIQDQRPLVTGRFEIDRVYRNKEGSGLPVIVPSVDLIEIGSGGGSIAHVDALGLLKVGPQSAGSKPGPACYNLGGTDATVTDADLVLGLVDAESFLGGSMRLNKDAAVAALSGLGTRLNVDTVTAARGIFRVVCEAMAGAARAHAADRGVDHRGLPIFAFGGAGPVHACAVAELLHSTTVVFPPFASVYSAFGALVTPPRLDLVRSALARLDNLDWDQLQAILDEMENDGQKALIEAGVSAEEISFLYSADMRYHGQQFEILIEFDHRPSASESTIRSRFEEEYLKRYKLIQPHVPVEVVNWRVSALGPATPRADLRRNVTKSSTSHTTRKVQLWQAGQDVPVMPRSSLRPGVPVTGPAIIEEPETTLVVPPGWTAAIGKLGSVVATRQRNEQDK